MNILLLLLTESPGALPQPHPTGIQQTWEQGFPSFTPILILIILIFLQPHGFGYHPDWLTLPQPFEVLKATGALPGKHR